MTARRTGKAGRGKASSLSTEVGTATASRPASKPKRATTEKQRQSYAKRREATYESASAAAKSLKGKPKTAYSLSKEARRLSKLPGSTVRPVSANAIRHSKLCHSLLDGERNAAVLSRDPRAFPDELMRMDKHQLIQQVLDERAWAVNESERRMALEIELGRNVVEAGERRRLGLEGPEAPAG